MLLEMTPTAPRLNGMSLVAFLLEKPGRVKCVRRCTSQQRHRSGDVVENIVETRKFEVCIYVVVYNDLRRFSGDD